MNSSVGGPIRLLRRLPAMYGLTWALFYAVLFTLTVSLSAHALNLNDASVLLTAYAIHCLAVLFGSIAAGRASRERGWYHGGLAGLMYSLLMVLVGISVYNTFELNSGGLFRVCLMTLIGGFGGIIGINLSPQDTRRVV